MFEDYQLTELLPYRGQSVEIQAGLYEILGQNNLLTAIEIVTEFASLVTPPLSAIVPVVDKVASGIEKVIEANASDPALALHGTLAAPGGGTGVPNELKPGWLAVVRATEDELPASRSPQRPRPIVPGLPSSSWVSTTWSYGSKDAATAMTGGHPTWIKRLPRRYTPAI